MIKYSLLLVVVAAVCSTGFSDCGETDTDAGDISWAHQTLPLLLGRKARGTAEVDAVANIVAQHDRWAVADALMNEPEYVDYWATVLVDMMGVRKSGFLAHPAACYNTGVIAADDFDNLHRLADHLRTATPSVAFTIDSVAVDWTMADAMRAAIVDDDLTVAYLAYLPVLVSEQRNLVANQAQSIADQFCEYYLDRNIGCTTCHSSHVSTVDDAYQTAHGTEVWDRHFTSPWNLDSSVFGGEAMVFPALANDHLTKYLDGETYFTTNCTSACHGPNANARTLMSGYLRMQERVPMMSDDEIIGAFGNGGMAGVPAPAGADKRNLLAFLRHRFGDIDSTKRFFQKTSVVVGGANRPWNMSVTCADEIIPYGIPDTDPPASFAGSMRRYLDVLDLAEDLRSGVDRLPNMLVATPGDLQLDDPSYDLVEINGQAAFAMMLTRRIANALVKEIYGARLVLDHGFSRNYDQAAALHVLATSMIVDGADRPRISLRNGLKQIMAMPQYNQLSPAARTDGPYGLPMWLNPWVADETGVTNSQTGVNLNGEGDSVHRYSATSLLWSTRDSLGWGEPTWFPLIAAAGPLADEYPRRDYVEKIGGRISDDLRGSDIWELSSLLYWESVAGSCGFTQTGGICVPSRTGDCVLQDWIDDVMTAARNGSISPAPTLRELLEVTRDRLLADPSIPTDEETQINASLLPPATTLASTFPADPAGRLAWEETLRHYCGALMTSPQYTMGGVATVTETPVSPRFTVCQSGGEPCTEHDLCLHHAGYLGAPTACP
jgi:hypothetical protein